MSTLIVVGARLNSSRLPKKHFLPLGGKPLIERLFERIDHLSATKVLATTQDSYNSPLVRWAKAKKISCLAYEGDINNLVGRVDHVVKREDPKYVVYVCGDCPLVDPLFIEQCLTKLAEDPSLEQIEAASDNKGRSVIHEGILVYSRVGWDKLAKLSCSPLEKEHVGLADRLKPTLTKGYVHAPEYAYEISHRVSVDTAADWRFMDALFNLWQQERKLCKAPSLKWAVDVIKSNKALSRLNSHVTQKSGLMHYGKALFITEAGSEVGIGQLTRSVRLAERLCEETGLGVEMIILGEREDLPILHTINHKWIASEKECWSTLKEVKNTLVILDIFPSRVKHKSILFSTLKSLKETKKLLIGLDQMAFISEKLDLTIVPSLFLRSPASDNVLYGNKYILTNSLPASSHNNTEKRFDLLITTGGSDAVGYGEFLPTILDQTCHNLSICWIQGPYARKPVIPCSTQNQWETIHAPESLMELVDGSRVVITVCGSTVYECLQRKAITAVLPAPGIIDESEYNDFLKSTPCLELSPNSESIKSLTHILDNEKKNKKFKQEAKALGIGRGLENTAKAITKLLLAHEERTPNQLDNHSSTQ